MSSVIQVATEAEFAGAIAAVAAAASGSSLQIVLSADIALAGPAPVIAVPDGVELTIDGQGHEIDGSGLNIASGTLSVSDLSIADAVASGTGGGLLVGGLADVTLDQVNFTGDQAVGTDAGAAEGGAIFVTAGGSLTYDSGSIAGSSVSGGAGSPASPGAGAGIFLQGAESIGFAPGAGETVTVTDAIADQSGAGGTGLDAGIGSIAKSGAGTLVLGADDQFTGDVTVTDGVLDLGNSNAAGTGAIVLAGSGTELVIGNGVVLQNRIAGFAVGSMIDLAGVGLIGTATIGAGDVLTAGTVMLQLAGDYSAFAFETRSDQHGGTDLVLAPAAPTLGDGSKGGLPASPTLSGNAPIGSVVTLFDGATAIGAAQVGASGLWSITATSLDDGFNSLTASFVDAAGLLSAPSAAVLVDVTLGQGYDFRELNADGDMVIRHYDPAGALSWVDVDTAQGLVLQSVDDTAAVRTVYDGAGAAIASISEPVTSADATPSSMAAAVGTSASLSTGTVGSRVTLFGDQVVLTTHGPDSVTAAAGNDSIFAGGASVSVTGGAATLLFVGNQAASTVTGASAGGTGSATLYGGAGGGLLEGGSDGHNLLVASGGNTTLVGGGSFDQLVAGNGSTEILAGAGDTAFGGAGSSTIYGAANAVLVGGSGPTVMIAGGGAEVIWAGTGTESLAGGSGATTLVGGAAGETVMVGGTGGTEFVCGAAAASCYGGDGNDIFFTGNGAALIHEGQGADLVSFGSGAATVTGGTGLDRYDFSTDAAGGNAVIAGFKNGTDQIELEGAALGSAQTGVIGGNTVIVLADGTQITLLGITGLTAGSIA